MTHVLAVMQVDADVVDQHQAAVTAAQIVIDEPVVISHQLAVPVGHEAVAEDEVVVEIAADRDPFLIEETLLAKIRPADHCELDNRPDFFRGRVL